MNIESIYNIFKKYPLITTDSRNISEGAMFFALKGENFNGNKFALDALNKGAAYAIIDEAQYLENDRTILVKDVLTTLQDLAKYHRSQLSITILGLTGSNGKTTTKELVHSVLKRKYNCLATIGNFNNHIGVPLTLLRINETHEIAIIEMGANHVGEIEFLCDIAKPNHGLITNIGRAHLGEFGGFDKVIQAKLELYKAIKKDKELLFVNGNDELLMERSKNHKRKIYNSQTEEGVHGKYLSQTPLLNVLWIDHTLKIRTNLIGKYNYENIMAAIAIGAHFSISPNEIQAALEDYTPANNRSQIVRTERNTLIMDAYNANPSSVEVALENLISMESDDKFFILGDMLELGEDSHEEHQNIYSMAVENKLNGVFIGKEYMAIFKPREGFFCYENTAIAQEKIPGLSLKDKLILLKGSRGIKLEVLRPLL